MNEEITSDLILETIFKSGAITARGLLDWLIDWSRFPISQELKSKIIERYISDNIKYIVDDRKTTTLKTSNWLINSTFGCKSVFSRLLSNAELSEETIGKLVKLIGDGIEKDYAYSIIKQKNFTKELYIEPEIFEFLSPFWSYIKKTKDWYADAEEVKLLEVINDFGDEKKDKLKLVKEGHIPTLKSCSKYSVEEIENNIECFNWWDILSNGRPIDKNLSLKLLEDSTIINFGYWNSSIDRFLNTRVKNNKPLSFDMKVAIFKNFINTDLRSSIGYIGCYLYDPWSLSTSFADKNNKKWEWTFKGRRKIDVLSYNNNYWIEKRKEDEYYLYTNDDNDEGRKDTNIEIVRSDICILSKFTGLTNADATKTYKYPNTLSLLKILVVGRYLFSSDSYTDEEIKVLKNIKLQSDVGEISVNIKGKTHIINAFDIVNAKKATYQYEENPKKYYFFSNDYKSGDSFTFNDNELELFCMDFSK